MRGKLFRKKQDIGFYALEREIYFELIQKQRRLRLKGIDIDVTALLDTDFSTFSRQYLGSVQAYREDGKKFWLRVGLDLSVEKRTYNNVLDLCIQRAEEFYKENKLILRKDLF